MDISMTTTVMPTVAALRPRTESVLGTGIAQPLSWHGVDVRTAAPSAGLYGRTVSDVPTSTGVFTGRNAVADTRTTAKQPHPPRGVPR
jgi:hypothetical protein